MAIYNYNVTTSAAGYTSGGDVAITTVIVCNKVSFDPANPTSGETYLYMYAVPNGSTAGLTNIIVNKLPIPAGETVTFDQEKIVLSAGDALMFKSESPDNLVATISTLAV